MSFYIQNIFEPLKEELLELISNFDSYDPEFGTGKRNSVKKIDLGNHTVVIKSFKIPNLINQIVYRYFRKSKARRSFEYGEKLTRLGFNTPQPIAYIENFSIVGLQSSYYVSEFVAYDFTFRELDTKQNKSHIEILKSFTKFTFDLHKQGIQFLDHSPGNTLIVKNNTTYDFYLVDLNRMKFGQMSFHQKMKNFSRLTPNKDMVKIMSSEYATLSNANEEIIFREMWRQVQDFQDRTNRKTQLKKKLLRK